MNWIYEYIDIWYRLSNICQIYIKYNVLNILIKYIIYEKKVYELWSVYESFQIESYVLWGK